MRCHFAVVSPFIAAALIIAVALILAALGTDNTLNSILFLGLAGTYVALYPGRGCRCSARRPAVPGS